MAVLIPQVPPKGVGRILVEQIPSRHAVDARTEKPAVSGSIRVPFTNAIRFRVPSPPLFCVHDAPETQRPGAIF